jgi:hypothetical protein
MKNSRLIRKYKLKIMKKEIEKQNAGMKYKIIPQKKTREMQRDKH